MTKNNSNAGSHAEQQQSPAGEPATPFARLVAVLAASALQAMGRLPVSGSGRAEIHLAEAQSTIDILEDLQKKTAGNLGENESEMLNETLTALRLNFVEVSRHVQSRGSESAQPPKQEETPPSEPPEKDAGGGQQSKEPRFHKSYG